MANQDPNLNQKTQEKNKFLLQWNINGLFKHLAELNLLLTLYQPLICCIQETHLQPTQLFKIKNYEVIRKDYTEGLIACGGVIILIHKKIHFTPIQLDTEIQALCVQIHIDNFTPSICSVYFKPDDHYNTDQIKNVVNQLTAPFILTGDFNAHSPIWDPNSAYTNRHGKIIEDLISQNQPNIDIINNLEPTYLQIRNNEIKSSIIDLTIISSSLIGKVNFYIHPDQCSSDHFPTLTLLNNQTTIEDEIQLVKWKVQNADWTEFNRVLDLSTTITLPIEDAILSLENQILIAAKNCIPTTKPFGNKKLVPWWNNKIKDAIKMRKKSLRTLIKYPTLMNSMAYKKTRATVKKMVREAKQECWEKFVSTLNSQTPGKIIWDVIRKISAKCSFNPIPAILDNDMIITKKDQIAEIIAKQFAHNSSNKQYNIDFLNVKALDENHIINFETMETLEYNSEISLNELQLAINSLKGQSVGPDNIHPMMLKKLSTDHLYSVLKVMNKLWKNGHIPDIWKTSIVVPIPKQDANKLESTSYRPISLTCCLSKVLEKIANKRLQYILENQQYIDQNQLGFRKGRSTLDNLALLNNYICNGFAKKQEVYAILFDIQKAYDTTWRYNIIREIHNIGLRGELAIFIQNFLSNRKFKVRANNCYSNNYYDMENGIPQGASISTTLFLIAINSIVKNIEAPVQYSLFADDLVIFLSSNDHQFAQITLQQTINKLEVWCRITGFEFNATKTKCIKFYHNRLEANPLPSLTLFNKTLKFYDQVKYLGVTFDNKLTFKNHINEIKSRTRKQISLMKCINHHKWGADYATLMKIYHAKVRAIIDYAAPVYNSSSSKSLLKSLEPIQNTCLRIALGAHRSSPIDSLYIMTGELPLSLRRDIQILKYTTNILSSPENPNFADFICPLNKQRFLARKRLPKPIPYIVFSNKYIITKKPLLQNFHQLPPWKFIPITIIEDNGTKKDIHPAILKISYQEKLDKFTKKGYELFYTDGSKIDNKTGAAFWSPTYKEHISLPEEFSVFSAELMAIKLVLNYILENNIIKAIICCDSQAATKAIKKYPTKHNLIHEIQSLHEQTQQRKYQIVLMWVPAHIGIPGNEAADAEAKLATTEEERNNLLIPVTDLNITTKNLVLNNWQNYWLQQTTNKLNKFKKKISPYKFPTNINRVQQRQIARLLIGHTVTTHDYIFHPELLPPYCEFCENSQLTINHIYIECPKYQQERSMINTNPNNPEIDVTNDHDEISNFLQLMQLICKKYQLDI